MEIKNARYKYNKITPKDHTKRNRNIIVLAVILLISVGYTTLALSKPIPEIEITKIALQGREASEVELDWPTNGQSAIGSTKDGVLASHSSTEQIKPIASMTKIITALAILEKSPLSASESGQKYVFTSEDEAILKSYIAKDGAVLPIKSGQEITQQQALQAILVGSANNIADSIVIKTFGSIDAYVVYANNFVKSKGLSKTTISDASGFSAQTTSTPSEMVVIGKIALEQPVIMQIVGLNQVDLGTLGVIKNTNKLLSDSTVIGIKTGTTDEAGSCLLFASKNVVDTDFEVTVVGVIMGSTDSSTVTADSKKLLDSAKTKFQRIEVAANGAIVGNAKSKWGQEAVFKTKDKLYVNTWVASEINPKTEISNIYTPLTNGQVVGNAKVEDNASVPIITEGYISSPSMWWRLTNYFQ